MSIVSELEKEECCGCSACMSICPVSAISMKTDEEGFLYPSISQNKCINCGLCEINCAFRHRKHANLPIMPCTYLVKHNNITTRMKSRSGGFFVAASDTFIKHGNYVCGCILDNDLKAVHVLGNNTSIRDRMCGSKYVQSDIQLIYEKTAKALSEGSRVLFSGTSCQIDAITSYLKSKRIGMDNLYTLGIVCHGTPSPTIYKDFLKWCEQRYGGTVSSIDFRDKRRWGWESHKETVMIDNTAISGNIYTNIFHTDLCIRPCCYNCKYASLERPEDITMADAWGVNKHNPEFHDNRGVSMIIIHTEKGKELFEEAKPDFEYIPVDIKDYMQPNLSKPSRPKGDRETFWNIYHEGGFDAIVNIYGKTKKTKIVKDWIKRCVRKVIKGKNFYLPM